MSFIKEMMNIKCECFSPDAKFFLFDKYYIGVDETNGRFGDVSIYCCKKCSRLWLHYLVEFEAYSKSGRWYRGLIKSKDKKKIKSNNAIKYLEKLKWYLYGGDYYSISGKASGKILI